MLLGGLLALGLGCKYNDVGVDHPIRSSVKGQVGGQGGVKDTDYDEEYENWGALQSPNVGLISPRL